MEPHLPQLAQSVKAMQQRAHDCIDHELHHPLPCSMSSILFPFASITHSNGSAAMPTPLPRASELTLLSCSTDPGPSEGMSHVGYRVFHNSTEISFLPKSEKIGNLSNWPFNTAGLLVVKYFHPRQYGVTHSSCVMNLIAKSLCFLAIRITGIARV